MLSSNGYIWGSLLALFTLLAPARSPQPHHLAPLKQATVDSPQKHILRWTSATALLAWPRREPRSAVAQPSASSQPQPALNQPPYTPSHAHHSLHHRNSDEPFVQLTARPLLLDSPVCAPQQPRPGPEDISAWSRNGTEAHDPVTHSALNNCGTLSQVLNLHRIW